MAIGNRLFAQTDEAGARPILFAATQISPEPATSARTVCASSVAIQHWSAAGRSIRRGDGEAAADTL
jgi:hypothetical protein